MQYKDVTIYQTPEEIENIRICVRTIERLVGAIAEVGVFGGIILLHDYPAHDGVKKAVDEFNFTNLTVLGGRQAIIQF